jgi:hypothetical protein
LVDVEGNPQLLIYGVGALASIPQRIARDIDTLVLHIVQPRHRLGGHSTWEVSRADLEEWRESVLVRRAEAAQQPGAVLKAGDHCGFCPAKAECPKLRDAAMTAAREAFTDKLEPVVPPALDQIPPQRLADILTAIPLAEKWFKAVREHASMVSSAGVKVPGYKTVRVVGNRIWRDAEAASAVLSLLGDVHTPPKPAALKSPAQVEKAIGKDLWATVAKFTTKPDKGTALVPESDKRPAHDATAIFKTTPKPN